MDKINNVARMAMKITYKNEKLQIMLNDKLIRSLEREVLKGNPKDFLEKLHHKIIPFKMQIIRKMYEVKTFEEVQLDINLGQLKFLIDGPNIVSQIK